MMERPAGVKSRLSWHKALLFRFFDPVKFIQHDRPPIGKHTRLDG
jgi:hypothetical protein